LKEGAGLCGGLLSTFLVKPEHVDNFLAGFQKQFAATGRLSATHCSRRFRDLGHFFFGPLTPVEWAVLM
jgi:hypothetical protein